jgi:hypothetical protein
MAKYHLEGFKMVDAKRYTFEEAQQHFAKTLNGKVWELLQKPDRSHSEDELMIYAAHASCYHWLFTGTGLHHQRGEWLIAHVYTVLGITDAALRHSARCLELTNEYNKLMEDFDWAYCYECVARANALAGNRDLVIKYVELAQRSGQAISNDEDKYIFLGDFNGGNWHGLR